MHGTHQVFQHCLHFLVASDLTKKANSEDDRRDEGLGHIAGPHDIDQYDYTSVEGCQSVASSLNECSEYGEEEPEHVGVQRYNKDTSGYRNGIVRSIRDVLYQYLKVDCR